MVGNDNWSVTDASRVTGTIGLRSYLADVYYDDVKVWKLVSSQPTIALGAEVARPIADKYYYSGSQRIGMRSGGALTYIFSDHLGGTSVTLNATTGVTSTVGYYPFGGQRASTGSMQTDRFTRGSVGNRVLGCMIMGRVSMTLILTGGFRPIALYHSPATHRTSTDILTRGITLSNTLIPAATIRSMKCGGNNSS